MSAVREDLAQVGPWRVLGVMAVVSLVGVIAVWLHLPSVGVVACQAIAMVWLAFLISPAFRDTRRGTVWSVGGVVSLVSGCYGWHPVWCAAAGCAAALVTAYLIDEQRGRR